MRYSFSQVFASQTSTLCVNDMVFFLSIVSISVNRNNYIILIVTLNNTLPLCCTRCATTIQSLIPAESWQTMVEEFIKHGLSLSGHINIIHSSNVSKYRKFVFVLQFGQCLCNIMYGQRKLSCEIIIICGDQYLWISIAIFTHELKFP